MRRAVGVLLLSLTMGFLVACGGPAVQGAGDSQAGGKRLPDSVLQGEALRTLIADSTQIGEYQDQGKWVSFAEYFSPDGQIRGADGHETWTGRWEVREGGCVYSDYEGTQADSCYYYARKSWDEYFIIRADGSRTIVRIVGGNPKGL